MSPENNKNNDKNKKSRKSFYRIMDKQGFYIILTLCLIIVAATAFWAENQKGDYFIGEEPTGPFGEDEQPEVILVEDDESDDKKDDTKETGKIGEGKPTEGEKTSSEDLKKDTEKDSKEKSEKEPTKIDPQKNLKEKSEEKGQKNTSRKNDKTQNKDTNKTLVEKDDNADDVKETFSPEDNSETPVAKVMATPVTGKLTLPFADDRLVFHKTLNQWSTHKGIDIQAPEGAPVRAALDGEVVEILNDTIMGISIVLKHDDELLTIYSNLSTDAMVKIGEQVKKGQIISSVGKTASTKTLEGPLLHFQVLKDDKFVDPELYLEETIA